MTSGIGGPVGGSGIVIDTAGLQQTTYTLVNYESLGIAAVQTGPGANQIGSLTFQPGSSLVIHDSLAVTSGTMELPGGSSVTLDGTLSASQFNMQFGALLNGSGSIIGSLVNGGVISPGFSPGAIFVSDNYVQGPGGALRIEIAGRKSGQYDQVNVGGTASLEGTLQLVRLDNFRLKRGDKVTFLTAEGGVAGRFALVESDFGNSDTILRPEIVYHDRSVALEMVQGLFADLKDLTPNQRAVAHALDRAVMCSGAQTISVGVPRGLARAGWR